MAFGKKLIDEVTGKDKKGHFMKDLGNWLTSPGGLATIALFAIAMLYAHSRGKEKKA